MKGLLIKDYKLIMHNKKMFLILMVVWFLALQNYDGYSFLIGYSIMTFVLLVLNTLSLDEYYKSMPYLITLPVKRTTYVSEKYVLMLGFSLFGAGLSIALCILLHRAQWLQILAEGLTIYLVLALLQLLMLPLQLKFGGDKGRIILIGLLSCTTVLAISIKNILPGLFGIQGGFGAMAQNVAVWFMGLPAGQAVLLILVICAICFTISYCISLHIMQKKEF